jgi:hypothetical protein
MLILEVSDERVLTLQNTLLEMQKPVCRMACQMDYIYSSIEGMIAVSLRKPHVDFETGNEKARIIKWISSLGKDYEKNHTTKARYRLKDSGQWLLRNQKYRHWLNISSCSVLWLHGGGQLLSPSWNEANNSYISSRLWKEFPRVRLYFRLVPGCGLTISDL